MPVTDRWLKDKSAVVGRYRHPCIISVLKIILFSKSSRARPIGLRFIRELMAETPPELLHEFKDKRATSGVPVPAIALASTLVRAQSFDVISLEY